MIGSLCSGYGGLDLALGGDVAWHAEVDAAASAVLAGHWPDVPNLGDITTIDWAAVEPVDIVCAGYPCQGESLAGKRKGADDERWIWPAIADAVRVLQPRILVLENVRGHLSLGASRVLADVAGLGFDAEWEVVPASAVGAPHRRERWFCVAAHPDNLGSDRPGPRCTGWTEPADRRDAPADGDGAGREGPISVIPAWRSRPARCASADPDGDGRARVGWLEPVGRDPHGRDRADVAWGPYEPAIRRWERVLGRPAPAPVTPGHASPNPRFVEWMQGLPEGWVTDVPGLSRSAQLRCLGNGVVPLQAALAVQLLQDRGAA